LLALMKYREVTVSRVSGSFQAKARSHACIEEAAGFEPEEELRLKESLEQAPFSSTRLSFWNCRLAQTRPGRAAGMIHCHRRIAPATGRSEAGRFFFRQL